MLIFWEYRMMVDLQTSAQPLGLNANDVRELCGDILDWKLAAILALQPTAGDVAAAVGWASGEDDLGQRGRPLEGVAAQVYELLISDEDYGEER
jgi:hypothetical protein